MQFSVLDGWMVHRDDAEAIDRPSDAHTHQMHCSLECILVFRHTLFSYRLSAICFKAPTLFHFKLFSAIIIAVNSNKFYFVVCWRLRIAAPLTKSCMKNRHVCNCSKCIHLMIVSLADNSQPQWIAERCVHVADCSLWKHPSVRLFTLFFISSQAASSSSIRLVQFLHLHTLYHSVGLVGTQTFFIVRTKCILFSLLCFHCSDHNGWWIFTALEWQRERENGEMRPLVFCLNFIYLFF